LFFHWLQRAGKWNRDLAWRYPLPDNLGLELQVDRGNVIKEVRPKSPASVAGLQAGDVVGRLNGVPVHSLADAQFALDRAPKKGSIEVVWRRDDRVLKDQLSLPDGWRKSDISWRPSLQRLVPAARLYGVDLTAEEKKALGLSPERLAFRQKDPASAQAEAAGIRPSDIIVGVEDRALELSMAGFLRYIERNYLVGDRVTINVLRDGKRLNLTMTLRR